MDKKVLTALNKQIKEEVFSSYLYLSMSAWFSSAGYDGMARWMRLQSGEETVHAMKFFDHLVSRGASVELLAIDKPQTAWESPLDAFKAAYKHEQYITGKIAGLVNLARQSADHATENMLVWFVNEQVEEEQSALKVIQALERVGDSGPGLFMLDRELGLRILSPAPAPGAETTA